MTSSERKTVGVFASQVGRAWGTQFLAGVTDAAEELNVNLVHFIGGVLTPVPDEHPIHPLVYTTWQSPISSTASCLLPMLPTA